MKRLLAFSGSFSDSSINHNLIEFTSSLLDGVEVEVIRLQNFSAPIYGKELEQEDGIPASITALRRKFDKADGFILSTPEYNSSVPAGLKNTLDWISRTEGKIFQDKPVLLMSTSPGGRGGQSVLDHLSGVLPYWGAKLIGPFSLPSHQTNLVDGEMTHDFQEVLESHLTELKNAL